MSEKPPRRRIRHATINAAQLPSVDPNPGHETVNTAYTAWIAQLYADLAESIDGVALQGSLCMEFGTNAGGVALSRQLSGSAGILRGWSIRETNGQPITIDWYDALEVQQSNLVAGEWRKIATTSLLANGKETVSIPNGSFSNGLGVVFAGTGIVTGVAYVNGVD